jgi:pilus assembly protein FimV
MIPDMPLDEPKRSEPSGLDFDLGAATAAEKSDFAPAGTFIREPRTVEATVSALDFDLGETKPAVSAAAATSPAGKSEPSAGLDFDLNLDLDETRIQPENGAPAAPDLSSISLDLGSAGEPAAAGGTDPKWQEVATKLDLAKAYEEMGDKDGARELLNEVMKDGDAAQRGQAEQILAKLG